MKVKYYFSKIPIIGSLASIGWSAQKEALIEMSLTVLFATLPIWFGASIIAVNKYFALEGTGTGTARIFTSLYAACVLSAVSNGELLMYTAALLGPTLYIGLSSFGRKGKPFPWIRPQLIFAVLLNLFATALFFMSREFGYAEEPLFVFFSLIFYLTSIILLFPAMAYEHDVTRATMGKIQRDDQDEFLDNYRRHRG
jgi:hypothetical protein